MLSNPTLRPCKSFIIVLSQVSPPRSAAIFSVSGLAGRSLVNRPIIRSLVWFRPGLFASLRTPSRHSGVAPVTKPAGRLISHKSRILKEDNNFSLQVSTRGKETVLCDNSQLMFSEEKTVLRSAASRCFLTNLTDLSKAILRLTAAH